MFTADELEAIRKAVGVAGLTATEGLVAHEAAALALLKAARAKGGRNRVAMWLEVLAQSYREAG